ncbi:hypothetical protein BC828DRAFT_387256 [Blastocladiella britannica]|nr:hypothetical protein BC828DRAFT_387256 [Blastocladiella britannica]
MHYHLPPTVRASLHVHATLPPGPPPPDPTTFLAAPSPSLAAAFSAPLLAPRPSLAPLLAAARALADASAEHALLAAYERRSAAIATAEHAAHDATLRRQQMLAAGALADGAGYGNGNGTDGSTLVRSAHQLSKADLAQFDPTPAPLDPWDMMAAQAASASSSSMAGVTGPGSVSNGSGRPMSVVGGPAGGAAATGGASMGGGAPNVGADWMRGVVMGITVPAMAPSPGQVPPPQLPQRGSTVMGYPPYPPMPGTIAMPQPLADGMQPSSDGFAYPPAAYIASTGAAAGSPGLHRASNISGHPNAADHGSPSPSSAGGNGARVRPGWSAPPGVPGLLASQGTGGSSGSSRPGTTPPPPVPQAGPNGASQQQREVDRLVAELPLDCNNQMSKLLDMGFAPMPAALALHAVGADLKRATDVCLAFSSIPLPLPISRTDLRAGFSEVYAGNSSPDAEFVARFTVAFARVVGEMGFPARDAARALMRSNGRQQDAIELLMSSGK